MRQILQERLREARETTEARVGERGERGREKGKRGPERRRETQRGNRGPERQQRQERPREVEFASIALSCPLSTPLIGLETSHEFLGEAEGQERQERLREGERGRYCLMSNDAQ